MRKVGYRCVDLKIYPGMRHEILNETDRLTVWNDILDKLS
jgi:alpha-beta hydrolase superfamily lysophospholipase